MILTSHFRPWVNAALAFCCAGLALACGDDDPIVPEKTTPPLQVVAGAPTQPSEAPDSTMVSALGYVVALDGLGADTVVGTTVGAAMVTDGELQQLDIWDDQGVAAVSTGRITALLRRQTNVLVAAENGLFHTDGPRLVPSPASDALAGLEVTSMAVTGAGLQEVVWFGTGDGIYRLAVGVLERWTIGGQSGAPSALWANNSSLFAAYGANFYRLDVEAHSAVQEALDFGTIHAIEIGASEDGGADVLFLATDNGLFERDEAGSYRQFTLSDGPIPAVVDDLVFDPKDGTYAVSTAGMVRLFGGGELQGVAELAERKAPRAVAGDDFGTVWVGDEESLIGMVLGTPLSFATDVKPIMEEYCMPCHAAPGSNNAPPVELSDYAVAVERQAEVTLRVATGQMPPATAQPLHADSLQILLRWYASGVNE